jgi:peroxiredoxin
MKRIIILMFASIVSATAISQSPVYNITGNIDGAEGVQFFLQKVVRGAMVNTDTAVVKGGTFKIKGGSVVYPEMVYLVTADKKYRLNFFLENSEITITGSLAYLNKAVVKGSKTQDDINSLTESLQPLILRYGAKNSELMAAKKSGDTAKADQLTGEIREINNEANRIQKDFIVSHPASFATPMILQSTASSLSAAELESVINSLDPEVAKSPIIIDLKSRLETLKKVEVGAKAPDFTQNTPDGKAVSLSSLTGKNILLVDFWAGWCAPCRAENPNVVKTYNEFKDKGFDILGVSLDRTATEWNKAIADDKLTWTHVSDLQYWKSSAAKLYGVNSIPANFLLDKNGIIIAKNLRGEELYNKVKELVGGK